MPCNIYFVLYNSFDSFHNACGNTIVNVYSLVAFSLIIVCWKLDLSGSLSTCYLLELQWNNNLVPTKRNLASEATEKLLQSSNCCHKNPNGCSLYPRVSNWIFDCRASVFLASKKSLIVTESKFATGCLKSMTTKLYFRVWTPVRVYWNLKFCHFYELLHSILGCLLFDFQATVFLNGVPVCTGPGPDLEDSSRG